MDDACHLSEHPEQAATSNAKALQDMRDAVFLRESIPDLAALAGYVVLAGQTCCFPATSPYAQIEILHKVSVKQYKFPCCLLSIAV